jgi:hypothetical protein
MLSERTKPGCGGFSRMHHITPRYVTPRYVSPRHVTRRPPHLPQQRAQQRCDDARERARRHHALRPAQSHVREGGGEGRVEVDDGVAEGVRGWGKGM